MFARLVLISITLVMTGCANVPESIQVAENVPLSNYQQVSADPAGNQEKTVRWGGVIAKVENLPEATMVEVVHYPLRSSGRPLVSDQSMGRFRVYVDGFLDPMVIEQGRSITFLGSVVGTEPGTIGEHEYVFPTVKSQGYHLWKNIERVEVSTIHFWPYHSYWGWGLHHGPFHQRVIIRGSHRQSGASGTSSGSSSRSSTGSGAGAPRSSSGNDGGSLKEY
ncbi:MAG: hypothetical protein Alis3KO_06580 [Aliiglaciecola sp.]|uniref:Slp family lipoprotein n=1 Tax=Aliiglaciecola sp. M165 TaxID=2593649 RepID=UPI00117EE193|nr:Slp family lipoprotein [Aliiglaciecola sp. M165]TRY29269.1 Slp family lipoprotein [Aliiglaciecola sp. M165]